MENIFKFVAEKLNLKESQVAKTAELLEGGATVPFIARYRKEMTGNLDENQITEIEKSVNYINNLNERKDEVIRLITEQGKLTLELETSIKSATILQEVEDIYFPFRKKRKTKADTAREQGLEGLATYILLARDMESIQKEAKKYINEVVENEEDAITGAKLIIAQDISETPKYREKIRDIFQKYGVIISKESKKRDENNNLYKDYYDYSENISNIPHHRVMAITRGEKEGALTVNIELGERDADKPINYILYNFRKELMPLYKEIVIDACDRLIYPSIIREVRNILTENAELNSIDVFKDNLKNLLMQPPLTSQNILALDPGYRTGCKVAVIDKNGFFKINDVFYLVENMHSSGQLRQAEEKMLKYIDKYDIDLIVIGNGTASRETESFVASVIKKHKLKTKYLITSEAGASVYSASPIANEEFPNLDVTVRGAISIGRRVQDPLAELIKIDPKSIGVGMYQHDVNQKKLDESLDTTILYVVNSVGANLNTASWALLSHISGVRKNVAKNIVEYRRENGDFKDRKQLLKVKGLGAKAYEQMAGFLTIKNGDNVLDNTIIHPESYHIAEKMLNSVGVDLDEYKNNFNQSRDKLKGFNTKKFAQENDFGIETVKDIHKALMGERVDPRESIPKPILKSDILDIKNLKEGMELQGTVRNVVDFGAFVDIGLKNDALLHISQMSKKFISHPKELVQVGDIIKVKVLDIDLNRKRVGLTLK